jgi:hypothetical protein
MTERAFIAGPRGTIQYRWDPSRPNWANRWPPPRHLLEQVGAPPLTHGRCVVCGEGRPIEAFTRAGDICLRCRNRARREREQQEKRERAEALAAVLGPAVGSTQLPRGRFALLYRCWAQDRKLLYVGITGHGMRRMLNHAEKGWFEREVAAVTFERVPAEHAVEAEQAVIRAERPRYNITHRTTP